MKGIPADFTAQVESEGFAMTDSLLGVDGNREILFGAAIPGGGVVYGALSSGLLQEACGEDTYLGEGYSYVLARDGEIVIPPVRYSYEQIYENMQGLLYESGNPEDSVDKFINALSEGRTGSVIFMINETEQLLCFGPVRTERNWVLVTAVPLAVAEREGARTIQTAMYMAFMIIAVIAVALATWVVFYLRAQRRQRENDRFLRDIYQAISENTDTVIFILDNATNRPDYVFENSKRLLGISSEEFFDDHAGQGQESEFVTKLQSLLQEKCPLEACQRELYAYNDRLHRHMCLKILICPFRLGDTPKCIYAVTDVTKERQDRERIEAAVAAAEQANAAKSSFFSSMSHDMRTPMNGIVGMTSIAKRNLDNRDRVLDCLNKIEYSSNHLLSLINDVLDISRIESGKLALASEPVDLPGLFCELELMLRSQCDDRKQILTVDLQIRHRVVLGDALRIRQIFMNLLSNAVKFTPEGGKIWLTVKEQDQKEAGHTEFQFVVADNGIGMSPEFQKTVFMPFERAGDSVVRQTEGTGLGMAITKNLVSAMGGQISVESEQGQGTAFYVNLELPLLEKELFDEPEAKQPRPEEISFAGRRFLLAEDNVINQEIVVEFLSGFGAKVEVAGHGGKALELFEASAPGYYDAILMDVQMPVMNGYEATAAIRSLEREDARRIPIIALTANALTEDAIRARTAGMNDHLAKPVEVGRLVEALQRWISREPL